MISICVCVHYGAYSFVSFDCKTRRNIFLWNGLIFIWSKHSTPENMRIERMVRADEQELFNPRLKNKSSLKCKVHTLWQNRLDNFPEFFSIRQICLWDTQIVLIYQLFPAASCQFHRQVTDHGPEECRERERTVPSVTCTAQQASHYEERHQRNIVAAHSLPLYSSKPPPPLFTSAVIEYAYSPFKIGE